MLQSLTARYPSVGIISNQGVLLGSTVMPTSLHEPEHEYQTTTLN